VIVRAVLASLVLSLAVGATAARAQDAGSRTELARLAAALEEAVGQVSAAAEVPVVGPGAGVRAIPLRGFGAVFVVPARALPSERSVIVLRRGGAATAIVHQTNEALAQREQAAMQARIAEQAAADQARAEPRRAKDRELETLELQAEMYQREAERARQEAERALESIARELRIRITEPSPPARPAVPAAPEAADEGGPLSPPAPPWRDWFRAGEEDARQADQVVADVKQALIRVLQDRGPDLRSLRPEEQLAVAVDFSSGLFFGLGPEPHTQRSLLVRVRKGDLDDRRAGRISPQELLRRIEQVEF
jgi:hypothetical protein